MKRCSIKAAWRQAREATDGRRILVVTKDDRRPVMASFSLNLYLLDLENRNYRDSDYDELYEILTGLQGYQVIDSDRVVTIDMDHLLKLEELRLGD